AVNSPLKQFAAAFLLRVAAVEDLPPRRARPVRIAQPLGDEPFEIEIAHSLEGRNAFAEHGLAALELMAPDGRGEDRAALLQWRAAHVFAVREQHIERDIDRRTAAKH